MPITTARRGDAAAQLQRLRGQVEQGHADHRPGREGRDQRDLGAEAQGQGAAEQGRKAVATPMAVRTNRLGMGTGSAGEPTGLSVDAARLNRALPR
ncbi:MAG: hypothetical protein WDM85_02965 [Caulobacteraceae bacterium]